MNNLQKTLAHIGRIFVGSIFIFSGFVKAVDPLGSTYKFNDYFTAFGTDWASTAAFSLAIFLALAEFLVGFALMFNLKIRLASLGALIIMLIMTPLTFVLALTNPVHDCGCFGDALILTNWQTFGKNLIILIPTLFLFIKRKKLTSNLKGMEQWLGVVAGIVFISYIMNDAYKHLPQIDFRPYKVGTYIPDAMIVPEGAPSDVWESVFIYEKNGEQQEFVISALPDSTWTFVSADHKLISKGYEPPIHDFNIIDSEGTEITDIVLASQNYNFLLIAYDMDKMSQEANEKINTLAEFAYNNNFPFYGLTASPDEVVNDYLNDNNAIFEFYNTDETTLKTIIRSNPGIVIVKEGIIIDKWHFNDIPDLEDLNPNLIQQSLSKYKNNADSLYIWVLILGGILLICLYLQTRKMISKS